jgi:hypothetical protein
MSKKNEKKTEVKCQDNTGEDTGTDAAKAALEALTDEQRAELLKGMGFAPKKAKKPEGPDPKEVFDSAMEKLSAQAFKVCSLLGGFPGGVAVTFERNPEDEYSVNVKRVRNKYGPWKSKSA